MPNIPMPIVVGLLVLAVVLVKVAGVLTVAAGAARLAPLDDAVVAGRWALSHDPDSANQPSEPDCGDRQASEAALWVHLCRDVSWLEIKKAASSVSVTSPGGHLTSYGADGLSIQCSLGNGVYARASAHWSGDELRLVLATPEGARVEETYSPAGDRSMRVSTTLVVPRGVVMASLQRNYTRS